MGHAYAEHQRTAGLPVAAFTLPSTANSHIGTTELMEINEKMVNEIYLTVIAKEVDTSSLPQGLAQRTLCWG